MKKLEELFNLPSTEKAKEDSDTLDQETKEVIQHIDATIDKIDAALPGVNGLDTSDNEHDELATLAKQSFEDLSNLGMNVDSRYASEIFAVAGTMLGHAINAKTAKLNKKLKMIELQLKKARLDQDNGDEEKDPITGSGHVLSRNELLERLINRDVKPN